jgi:DNA replication ATP-dependent helicase Dna2
LLRCGIKEEQLAIVSVYRSQLRTISRYFERETDIEIATIDKYQGRDKDCVIISLVRSNTQGNVRENIMVV